MSFRHIIRIKYLAVAEFAAGGLGGIVAAPLRSCEKSKPPMLPPAAGAGGALLGEGPLIIHRVKGKSEINI
jgi:hypothetical protein